MPQFYRAEWKGEVEDEKKGYTRLVLSKESDTPASGRALVLPVWISEGRGCGFCFSRQVRLGRRLQSQTVKVKQKDAQYSPGCDFT